ncbi:TolC family protein [Terrimonas sp. NA20]|uniref:TolC family protein n=1 Tax=Terrimonas ginsenosidimutans TaxID=2908004 RepID=A0ABS9L0B2_9BACT|nr:TolC family protein [Terrimonas ginsenosidimutans]MCG2618019.1 TolC family protein [Terrimonas ginsenosidimutans]
MRRFITAVSFAVAVPYAASSQTHLERYVEFGLGNNESVKQQQFILEKNLYALKEAKSLFFPTVSFNSTYTLAGGGRTVDIPIGDLMNPVYATLNQLTASNNFPQVKNQSVLLNPDNFYDARLHTIYPIINAELNYNKKIKGQQYDLQKTEIGIYKRELAKDIKIAYYNYLKATQAIRIYESALSLVKENERINTSLFNNEKVNRTSVIRSTNEVTKINAQLNTEKQTQENAKAYFNFLLNQPLNSAILADSLAAIPDINILSDTAVNRREELLKLNTASAISENLVGLANSYKRPKLNSFLDVGSQGFDFKVNSNTRYYFLGLSLEYNIFSGGKNKHKVKQAEADLNNIKAQTSYVSQQLALQVKISANTFKAAVINYQAALSQVDASEKYYRDMLRLYKEGSALFIELLDAQNQLVSAQLQANISLYDTWIRQSEIERANAGLLIK